jgi:hypothetical protein
MDKVYVTLMITLERAEVDRYAGTFERFAVVDALADVVRDLLVPVAGEDSDGQVSDEHSAIYRVTHAGPAFM